jgi:hypothetical protein
MYLAANLGDEGGRPENIIALRVLEQEVVLGKIITSMNMIDDDPLVAEMAIKLEELSALLSAGDLKEGEGEDAVVNTEKMEVVYSKIDKIRGWIVA